MRKKMARKKNLGTSTNCWKFALFCTLLSENDLFTIIAAAAAKTHIVTHTPLTQRPCDANKSERKRVKIKKVIKTVEKVRNI